MAKSDLIQNPDFELYQKDLRKRLEEHIRTLHNFVVMPSEDKAALEKNLLTIHSLKAVIAENESILRLPEFYVPKEGRDKVKNKMMQIILSIWRGVFIEGQDPKTQKGDINGD